MRRDATTSIHRIADKERFRKPVCSGAYRYALGSGLSAVSRPDRGSSQHNMVRGWIDMQRLARVGAGVASSEYSEKLRTCTQPSEQGTSA